MVLPTGLQRTNCRRPPFWQWYRLCYLGRVSEVRLCRINFWQCSAINLLPSRPELFSCSSGWLPVAWLRFAVAGKHASLSGWEYGVRYGGARFLAESAAVVAALPHWAQNIVPLLRIAASYLLLPVGLLAWVELSAGKFRLFIRALIFISLAINLAGIGFFIVTGSDDKLIPYNNFLATVALLALVIVVVVPALSRKFLVLPNRAVMVVGTLVFAGEALYFSLSRLLHYHSPTTRLTGSLGLAVLLFSFGYVATQLALASERRLLSIENELTIAREIQASILPDDNPKIKKSSRRYGLSSNDGRRWRLL
jgi:uncharacterized membrane protein YgdD (TMEM256/DUF423 family)